MVDYTPRKRRTRIRPRSVEIIRGAKIPITSLCHNPRKKNAIGTPLEQLEEQYYSKSTKPYPNTLVVIVGHSAPKLAFALSLYMANKPQEEHDLFLAFNGNDIYELVDRIPEVPRNCVCEPVVKTNWGWDLGMYAEAVMNYKYDRYFFINDDVIKINGNKWLAEFESEVKRGCGIVGVQGQYFIRTTYYGATRTMWLSLVVAILSGCVEFSAYRLRRMFPRLRNAGAVDAFCFESVNRFFADRCGFKIGWLSHPHTFMDRNCVRYKKICGSQWKDKPCPYFIDRLGNGLEERISVDYVINWAKQHGIRDIH